MYICVQVLQGGRLGIECIFKGGLISDNTFDFPVLKNNEQNHYPQIV